MTEHDRQDPPRPTEERRQEPRSRPTSLISSIGPVIDISARGMKVQTTRAHRGEFDVTLEGAATDEPTTLRARVRWRRNPAPREFVIGLEFIDMSTEQGVRLLRLVSDAGQDSA